MEARFDSRYVAGVTMALCILSGHAAPPADDGTKRIPAGSRSYALHVEATILAGAKTFKARAREPYILERAKFPVTRQYIRLYADDSRTWGPHAIARLAFRVDEESEPR